MNERTKAVALMAVTGAALTLAFAPIAPARADDSGTIPAGLTLAQQRCGACHVIVPGSGAGWTDAPPFDQVANRQGMSEAWLMRFIPQDHAHMINSKFTEVQLRQLSSYIMSLRGK